MGDKGMEKVLSARPKDSHKGDYGHVFVLAGAIGLTGAAYLASSASLLAGSGLVTLGIPESLNAIMATKLTEVMTLPLPETKEMTLSLKALPKISNILSKVDALAIGPGLSQHAETQKVIRTLLPLIRIPAVIDADGINAIAGGTDILNRLKTKVILTPHPGEFARLLGVSVDEVQKNRISLAKSFTARYNVTLILKGYQTIVAAADGVTYVNETGNPGMATAGSGDVLTGIIAAFLGQRIDYFPAAKYAVYLHGLAGDLAAREKGQISLVAQDILNNLPQAFKMTS